MLITSPPLCLPPWPLLQITKDMGLILGQRTRVQVFNIAEPVPPHSLANRPWRTDDSWVQSSLQSLQNWCLLRTRSGPDPIWTGLNQSENLWPDRHAGRKTHSFSCFFMATLTLHTTTTNISSQCTLGRSDNFMHFNQHLLIFLRRNHPIKCVCVMSMRLSPGLKHVKMIRPIPQTAG